MLTKGAIGNLVNRYKAVLKKCNLINTFGSLAVASMLVMGGAGVAEAKKTPLWGGTHQLDGTLYDDGDKSRIFGGWDNSNINETGELEKAMKPLTTDITVIGGDFTDGLFTGGHYLSGVDADVDENGTPRVYTVTETNITVGGDVKIESVIGGSGFSNSNNSKFETGTTNLIITGGTYERGNAGDNVPEAIIVGGDFVKIGDNAKKKASSHVGTANMLISGGTFNAAIIGGSAAIHYYNAYNEAGQTVTVDTTNTKIIGGTFNEAIVAGGLSHGRYSSSTVKTANLTIDGSDGNDLNINSNIYAGGLRGLLSPSVTNKWEAHTNTVNIANIKIINTTVENIYGHHARMYTENKFDYSPTTGELEDHVTTNLTFINSTANIINIPKGRIELRVENNGTVEVTTLKKGDDVPVDMTADGAINDAVGGAAGTQGLLDSKFKVDKEVKTGSFTMDAGAITGKVTGTVTEGIADVTEAPNETNVAMADLPNINHMITRVEMNDLRKRMGDIRLLEGNTGLWARWDGGKLKGDSGLTNDFHKIQAGIDTTTGIDNLRLGAAFSYTNGDMEFAKADAESDTMSLAAYGVWTADNGMFSDVIARLAFIDTEIQTDKVKGDLDNLAFSLSGEYGWRFDLCDKFFVEPQLELTYTYIDSDEFKSAGAKFDFDSTDSLIGRAGLAAGWKLPNELGELYARASVVQEFMGDGKLTASMGSTVRRYETDNDDTWFEYGVGANVKISKNAYIFADVERTEGAEIDEEWRGTVGFRFSF